MKTALWDVCRPLSPLTSQLPASPYHPVRLVSPLTGSRLGCCMVTHLSQECEVTLQVPRHCLEIHFWEKLCLLPPLSPLLLESGPQS